MTNSLTRIWQTWGFIYKKKRRKGKVSHFLYWVCGLMKVFFEVPKEKRNKPFSPAASSQNTKVWHRSWMAEIGPKFSSSAKSCTYFVVLTQKIQNTNFFLNIGWAFQSEWEYNKDVKWGGPRTKKIWKVKKETYSCDPIRLWEWLLRFIGPLGSLGPDYPHNLNIISTSSS